MKRYLSVQKSVFQGKTRSTQETLPSKTCSWAKELKILRRLTTLLAARCRRRRHHWLFYWSLSKKILLIYFRCFLLSRCQRIPKKKCSRWNICDLRAPTMKRNDFFGRRREIKYFFSRSSIFFYSSIWRYSQQKVSVEIFSIQKWFIHTNGFSVCFFLSFSNICKIPITKTSHCQNTFNRKRQQFYTDIINSNALEPVWVSLVCFGLSRHIVSK